MGVILKLSDKLSNMIAAGEVVEKPSSVVKELVENSIDAKADTINISLIDSGIKEITVLDNGCGMSEEDAKLSFERHATSKIKNEYDLFRINTLGFRGEAIPSIASVSKFDLKTCDGFESTEIVYNGGKFISEAPCAMNKGTQIKVSNLFYNVPARLKYLRTLSSELSSITYLVSRFILANPFISFQLTNNNKVIYKTSGNNDLKQIFGSLYGLEVARNMLFESFKGEGYKMDVIACKGMVSRSNKLEITTIVNGRFVRSNKFNDAIIDAYKTYIPEGRYPIALLRLEIDPLLIDVNVHPSKQTIKISSEDEIASLLKAIVRGMLEKTSHIPDAIKEEVKSYKKETIFSIEENNIKEPLILNEDKKEYNVAKEEIKEEKSNDDFTLSKLFSESENIIKQEETKKEYTPSFEVKEENDSLKLPLLHYVGSVFGTYLVFESPDGMYLMDQHAAAERINYEYYLDVLTNPKNERTPLIVPIDLELTKNEMIDLENNLKQIEDYGFRLSQSGETSYFIREIPTYVHFDDAADFVRQLIYAFKESKKKNIEEYRDRISKQIACKSSIKANHQITKDEVDALVKGLNQCKNPYTCPHGRPTIVKFSILDLEKMFKRVI